MYTPTPQLAKAFLTASLKMQSPRFRLDTGGNTHANKRPTDTSCAYCSNRPSTLTGANPVPGVHRDSDVPRRTASHWSGFVCRHGNNRTRIDIGKRHRYP
jgi:hypothetical protein